MVQWGMQRVVVLCLGFGCLAQPLQAEEDPQQKWETMKVEDLDKVMSQAQARGSSEPKEPSPEEVQQAMQMMGPMFAEMMGAMIEGMAASFAKPQVAEHFATFMRQYYQALVTRGFTEEEAMKIVTASSLPSVGSMGQK